MEKPELSKLPKIVTDLGIAVDCNGLQLIIQTEKAFTKPEHVISALKRAVTKYELDLDGIRAVLEERDIHHQTTVSEHLAQQSLKVIN